MSPMIIKAMASTSQRKDTSKNAYSAKGVEESISNAKRIVSSSPKF